MKHGLVNGNIVDVGRIKIYRLWFGFVTLCKLTEVNLFMKLLFSFPASLIPTFDANVEESKTLTANRLKPYTVTLQLVCER